MTTISNHRVGRSPLRDHSAKTFSEAACQALPLPIQNSKSTIQNHHPLLPLNPDYDPIPVAPHEGPEMVVVGEWVSSID
jgi:hypothetical protein